MIDAQQIASYQDEPVEMQEEAPEERDFSKVIETIQKYAKDIQTCCDEMDPEVLKDLTRKLEATDELILRQGFEDLDDDIKKALKEMGELDPEEAHEIAGEVLESVDDPYRLAGWLVRVGHIAQQFQNGEDEEEAPEEAPADEEEDLDDFEDEEDSDDFEDEDEEYEE